MKKFVTMTLSLLLAACILVGCGGRMDEQTTDTTTTTNTTGSSMPTERAVPKDVPETSSMPSVGNSDSGRSSTHRKLPHADLGNR